MTDHVTGDDPRPSEREEAVLRALVEEYIATARPVGSGRIAERSGVALSSATVRKDLSALEDRGFLDQPHTSAGRVPTDKGYRYFVDSLMAPSVLDEPINQKINDFFAHSHGELERILAETSRLLSGVTGSASVVVAPRPEAAVVRGVQLVVLEPQILLLVIVLSTGGVERRTVHLSAAMSDDQVSIAQTALSQVLVEGRSSVVTGDPEVDGLVADSLDAVALSDDTPRVHVGGRATIADVFDETSVVADVLRVFERQLLVVTLIRDVLDRGLRVAIGAETGVRDLNECSIVVAPYQVDGAEAGSIGVLGPTHMNYPQALAAVAVVSSRLSERLTRG